MKKYILLSLFLGAAEAKDLQLENLWKKSVDQALAIKASKSMTDASRLEMERSNKHWLPQVYATGNSYITNDPGANMFGLLSQRDIKQADFIPDSLNNPSSSLFSKGAIGINLPIYEGGQKSAINKAMGSMYEGKKREDNFVSVNFYSEFVKTYSSLLALDKKKIELTKIKMTLDNLLNNYNIGNKSNMLGYSGLLGLKSLDQKLIALTDENTAKINANQKAIIELTGDNSPITFNTNDKLQLLLNEYLQTEESSTYKPSEKVESYYENAKAAKEIIDAEKSRNLPRIGLFAESYAFKGDRKTSTGYTTGLYLNWNLFSSSDLGTTDQAIAKAHSAQYFAEANSQKEKMDFMGMQEMKSALIKTLSTLNESEKLLDEQIKIANSLFRNGMINALQLVEVLSRRVDLISLQTDANLNLIHVQSQLLVLTNSKPALINGEKI